MMQERAALEQRDRGALVALVLAQQARVAVLEAQVAVLTARVEELGGSPPAPPAASPLPPFVKPARRAKQAQGPRKRRDAAFGRRRMTPTRVVEHAVEACPGCGAARCGGEVVRRRQVLHIPPAPVEVIEHVARRRVCPQCGRAHTPPLDLGAQVFGQQRLSLATLAYIASLRAVGRLPLRAIHWLLATLHGLRLRLGGLAGVLRAVADRAQPALEELRARVRGSPLVHADETGWREDGANGDVWCFGTPERRYFHRDASRGGAVVAEVLGEAFAGALVSDFYAAYNTSIGPAGAPWAGAAGRTSCAMSTTCASPTRTRAAWRRGPPPSTRSTRRPSGKRPPRSRTPPGWRRGTPWSASWRRCASRSGQPPAPPPKPPSAAASTASSTSCAPSSPTRRCRPTITLPSAASARW